MESPSPSRTIAIGDVHGCALALALLLDAIDPQPEDTVVPLGDYVDRGPDSRGVLELLLQWQTRCHLVPLLGNHEIMLLNAFEDPTARSFWLSCGGQQTLESYSGRMDSIPEEHLEFLRGCRDYHETDDWFFIHANYDPRLPISSQSHDVAFWKHLSYGLPEPHVSGKRAVVGHTPQPMGRILLVDHLICLDTAAFAGGWLSAMDTDSGMLWQTNLDGELRVSQLPL